MADVVPISGGPEQAKIRHVLAPIGLGIITLGFYFWFWWYYVNREMADLGRKNGREDLGTSPGTSLLAVTLGVFLIVPPILSIIGTWKRMKRSQQLVGLGENEQGNAWIYGLLVVFGLSAVAWCYFQSELNKVWRQQPGAGLNTSQGSPIFTTTPAQAATTTTPAAEPTTLPGVPGTTPPPESPTNLPGIPGG